jgi:HK97 family phage major capsid protein
MSENRDLRQQRYTVLTEARALKEKGAAMTPQERSKLARLVGQAQQLRERIERVEGEMMGTVRGGAIETETRTETTRDRDHQEAFRSYLRYGKNEMPVEHRQFLETHFRARSETRDMVTGGGNALQGVGGGYLVPIGFSDRIETALKFSGNLMKVCEVMPTETGAPLPWPTADDTQQQAELIGEGQQVTEGDVNLSNIIFGSYKFSSKLVKCSIELVEDSYFPIEDWLADVLGVRFARALNQYFTTGTGTNQPRGLVTAVQAAGNVVQAVGSSANTGNADGTNTIGSTDILNLIHSVDPLYREDPSCRLKYGRLLFPQTLVSGAPDMICGYEVALNNAMDQLQSTPSSPKVTRYTMAFGPMKKYLVRKVKDLSLMVLRERFMDYGLLAYIAWMRVDGNLLSGAQEAAQAPLALLSNTY